MRGFGYSVSSCGTQIGGHAHLSKCARHSNTCPTYISGEAFFEDGRLTTLTNKSGTFRSDARHTMYYSVRRFYDLAAAEGLNRTYGTVKFRDCVSEEKTRFSFE